MSESVAEDKAPAGSLAKHHRTTIYDIARHAGVNPSTVSRALNKPGRVNAETVKRIREVAAALDFRINPMARALPTGMTRTIGLVMSDITNPVYFNVVRGAGQVTAAEDYTLVLAESQESAELEAQTVQRLLPSVDGIALIGTRLTESDIRDFALRKPVILVNRAVEGVPSVIPDLVPGIAQALAHLEALGHRSIAFLSGPASSWISAARWELILTGALERGMTVVEIGPGRPTLEGGETALKRILAAGVTAAITYNDLMAIGLLTACQDSGIPVPAALSIIGFDDIFGSAFTSPPLTTVQTPLHLAGEVAVRHLIRTARHETGPAPGKLTTELIARQTTGSCRPD
ncbi:LacI family transcriptional regulator [Arthrobacter sp. Z1-9]